jgi:hypothetical protein
MVGSVKIYKKCLINLAIVDLSFRRDGNVRTQQVKLGELRYTKNVLRNLAIADLCMVTLNCIPSFIFMRDG